MIVRKFKTIDNAKAVWNKENPFINHYYTNYALLVPESENYILRSSNHFFKNSQYKEDLKKCFAQEGNHSKTHGQFASQFKKLGYKIEKFMSLYKKISYQLPESQFSKTYNLVGAAACEQLNTAISCASLEIPEVMDGEGETFEMLKWHFLEEIEHREVIFNLMKENKPSFLMQSYVMFNYWIGFSVWIPMGAFILGFQDGSWKKPKFWWQGLTHSLRMSWHFMASSIRFCRSSYHPADEKLPKIFSSLQQEFS